MKLGTIGDQSVNVTLGGAQATILVCVVVSTGTVYAARLAGSPGDVLNKPGQMLRIALGSTVILVVLLTVSYAAPEFARAMGWLILLGTIIGYGSTLGVMASRMISTALGHSPVVSTTPANAQLLTGGDGAAGLFSLPQRLAAQAAVSQGQSSVHPPNTAPDSAWQLLARAQAGNARAQ